MRQERERRSERGEREKRNLPGTGLFSKWLQSLRLGQPKPNSFFLDASNGYKEPVLGLSSCAFLSPLAGNWISVNDQNLGLQLQPEMPASHCQVRFWMLHFWSCSLCLCLVREKVDEAFVPMNSSWETQTKLWILIWLSPGWCDHLGSEPVAELKSLSVSLTLSKEIN